jgi:galactan 5-O-arabinofuranosyltransferase
VLLASSVTFVAVSAKHLVGLLTASGAEVDRYFYFDTYVQPTYVAMWRTDLPGAIGTWPPPGEFAGVGLVSALLVVGLGLALFVGHRRSDVLVLAACLAGAWLLRLHLASRMWADNAVQLYPRTTPEILFCLLAIGVLAIMVSVRRVFIWLARLQTSTAIGALPTSRVSAAAGVAVVASALLAGLSMGASTADRYMPRNDGSTGYLAFVAHHVRQPDGSCAAYVPASQCLSTPQEVDQLLRR